MSRHSERTKINPTPFLTRQDGLDFLALAGRTRLATQVEVFPLADANCALDRLRRGELNGAAVLAVANSPAGASRPGET